MGESSSDVVVVMSTFPATEQAGYLARMLIDEQLCACVNLAGGVQSFFYWEGSITEKAEQLALLKTTRGKVDALLARLAELHPYDVPEALVLPIAQGLAPYLAWVAAEVNVPREE